MSGRFLNKTGFREIRIRFNVERDFPLLKPRYNIAPGQDLAVVLNEDGGRSLKMI